MIVDKPWGKVATYALNQPSRSGSSRWSPRRRRACTTTACATRCGSCSTPVSPSRSATASSRRRRGRSSWSQPRRPTGIRNVGTTRGRVLEIAYGYTTEDDTLRLEDAYGRPLEPDW